MRDYRLTPMSGSCTELGWCQERRRGACRRHRNGFTARSHSSMQDKTQQKGILMHLSDTGRALLRDLEGCRTHAYADTAGLLTIGIGHRLTQVENRSGT